MCVRQLSKTLQISSASKTKNTDDSERLNPAGWFCVFFCVSEHSQSSDTFSTFLLSHRKKV